MRRAAVLAIASFALAASGATAGDVAPIPINPSARSDEKWLAEHLLTDAGQNAQVSFLGCLSQFVIRDPRSGLSAGEATNPGLTDYVEGEIYKRLRTKFSLEWPFTKAAMAEALTRYPASERTEVRAFFASPTGTKFLDFIDQHLAVAPAKINPQLGFKQCSGPPPSMGEFDTLMSAEDRQRFAAFPANPGNRLTPGSALELAAGVGGRGTAAFFERFVRDMPAAMTTARANFVARRKR